MGARKLAGTFVALVVLAGLAWGQPGPETPEIRDYSTFVDVLSRTPADEPSDQAFVGLATAPRVLGATGTAAVSIPIYMPPGRGEANPLFDPSYSSHREDGLLGAGWDLLVGCIKRSTKEGVPFLYQKNPSDPFRYPVPGDGVGVPGEYVLQIGGEQVSLDHYLGTGPGGHLFGSTAEERFWRVAFDPASNTWVVTQKTGVRFVFGAGGPETRSGFDVSQAGGTFSWGLVRIEDPNGNVVDYSYGTHGLEFPLNRALYPTRVQWGANPGAGYAHVYEIEVLYEDRPDRPPSYLFGFEFYRSVRPSEIVVRALGETVRRYEFEYEQAPYVGTTRLVRVRAFGAPTPEEPGGLAYPPSTFVYADGPTGFGEDVSLPVQGGWGNRVQLYDLYTRDLYQDLFDIDGDSLADIVMAEHGDRALGVPPALQVLRNTGNGFAAAERTILPFSPNFQLYNLRATLFAHLDLDGDYLIDAVDTACDFHGTCYWQVLASVLDSGEFERWLSPSPDWFEFAPMPAAFLEEGLAGVLTIELNGDGRADRVWCDVAEIPPRCTAFLNTGEGFSPTGIPWSQVPYFESAGGRSALSNGNWYDMNGDGLADHVGGSESGWHVHLNTGKGFTSSTTTWLFPGRADVPKMRSGSTDPCIQHAYADAVISDVNGDGRPDYVDSSQGTWRVYINTGDGFQDAIYWSGTHPFEGAPDNWIEWWEGLWIPSRLCYFHEPRTLLADLDGDRLQDWVFGAGGFAWKVRYSEGGRTHELVEVHNGFGAVYEIRYKAAAVFRAEGLVCDGGPLDGKPCESAQECSGAACSPAAEKPVYAPFPVRVVESVYLRTGYADAAIGEGYDFLTEFRYSGPAYDPEEREFRGFRWTVEVDPQRGRRTETEFRQAADPFDPSSRAQARPYRRKLARRRVVDATTGSLLVEEVFTWQAPTLPDGRRQVTLSSRSETRYGTDGTSSQTLSRAFLYDEFANPVLVQESADGQPVRTTSASYSYDLGSYIVDRPAQIHRAGLASRRFTYDSRGNPTRIEDWLDTRGVWVSTDLVYDAAGLLVSRTDPRGYTTTVDWSCNLGLYPCTVTDSLGHQQGTTYDLRWGRISELVDANGASTSYDYDSFGRLASIVRVPAIDPEPWRKFTYVFGSAPMPSRIETHVREPYGYRREVVFFDSVGRELQRRRDDVVDGAATVVVSGAVKFDEAGRIRSRTVPYETTQPVDVWYPPPGTQKTTEFEYDALDRESKRTHPNGTYRTWDYSVAGRVLFRDENATAYDDGKRTNVSGAGRRTEKFYDALGRLLETKEYDGPMDATGLRSHVRYAYDGLDRLLSVTTYAEDGTAFTTSFTYDSLGRRIELSDPNSGVWRYKFDVVGNPVYQDDPEPDRHVEMCYDELGRLHCRYTFSDDSWRGERICPSSHACPSIPGGTLVEEYFHDVACSNGKGRLCAVEDSSGWTSFSYDARGRLVESTKEIRAAGLVRNFTFETTYDVADRVQSLLYPTRSGTENVTYLYDNAGRLLAANAPGASYFFDARYDVFGRPTNLRYGNGAVATWEYYASGENRFRLQRIKVVRNSSTLQDFKYTAYDKAGNLLRIVDPNGYGYSDSSTLDNDWQFSYDGLGRLVEMVPPSHPQWQGTQDFSYDRLSNLTRRGSLSIEHALSTGFPNRILATDPPGMAQSFEYDASGELLRRPETTGGGSEAYAISYDALGRVSRIEAQGSVVEYVRDYTGRVAAKLVDGVPTFYFGELFELRGDQLVRHVYAGERRIAQNVATLSESSPLLLAQAGGGSELLLLAALLDGRRLERLEQALGTSRETLKLLALASFLLLLGLTPGRVRPRLAHQRLVFFGWVRQGHVLLLLFVFGTSVLPLTCVSSARATGGGGGGSTQPPLPTYFVHFDHLGSPTMLTCYKQPSSLGCPDGAVAMYFRYDAYGTFRAFDPQGNPVPEGTELTDRLYTGQRWESTPRLYDYRARFYDPEIARFTSLDPAREGVNLYAYVGWNPVARTDPSGMIVVPEGGGTAGVNFVYGLQISGGWETRFRDQLAAGLLDALSYRGDPALPDWYLTIWAFRTLVGQGLSPASAAAFIAKTQAELALDSIAGAVEGVLSRALPVALQVIRQAPPVSPASHSEPNASRAVTVFFGAGGSATAITGAEIAGGGFVTIDAMTGEVRGGLFGSGGLSSGLNVSADLFAGAVYGELSGTTMNANLVLAWWSLTALFDPATGHPLGLTWGPGPSATDVGFSWSFPTTATIDLVGSRRK